MTIGNSSSSSFSCLMMLSSWEPDENLLGCQRLLQSFWGHIGMDDQDHLVGYEVAATEAWISCVEVKWRRLNTLNSCFRKGEKIIFTGKSPKIIRQGARDHLFLQYGFLFRQRNLQKARGKQKNSAILQRPPLWPKSPKLYASSSLDELMFTDTLVGQAEVLHDDDGDSDEPLKIIIPFKRKRIVVSDDDDVRHFYSCSCFFHWLFL